MPSSLHKDQFSPFSLILFILFRKNHQKYFFSIFSHQKITKIEPNLFSLFFPTKKSQKLLQFFFSLFSRYGLRETELLYALSELDHRVKPFVLLVHKWAEGVGVAKVSKGKFFSIQLTYLALHFLQRAKQPILPPLEKLYTIQNADQPTMSIDIHQFDFKTDNTNAISELFREFLEYYAAFDVSKNVVTMRTLDDVLKPVNSAPVVKETRRMPTVIPMYMEKIFFPNGNFAGNITDIDYQLLLIAIQKTLSALDEYSNSDKKEVLQFLV